jgi:hypothetical protein
MIAAPKTGFQFKTNHTPYCKTTNKTVTPKAVVCATKPPLCQHLRLLCAGQAPHCKGHDSRITRRLLSATVKTRLPDMKEQFWPQASQANIRNTISRLRVIRKLLGARWWVALALVVMLAVLLNVNSFASITPNHSKSIVKAALQQMRTVTCNPCSSGAKIATTYPLINKCPRLQACKIISVAVKLNKSSSSRCSKIKKFQSQQAEEAKLILLWLPLVWHRLPKMREVRYSRLNRP